MNAPNRRGLLRGWHGLVALVMISIGAAIATGITAGWIWAGTSAFAAVVGFTFIDDEVTNIRTVRYAVSRIRCAVCGGQLGRYRWFMNRVSCSECPAEYGWNPDTHALQLCPPKQPTD